MKESTMLLESSVDSSGGESSRVVVLGVVAVHNENYTSGQAGVETTNNATDDDVDVDALACECHHIDTDTSINKTTSTNMLVTAAGQEQNAHQEEENSSVVVAKGKPKWWKQLSGRKATKAQRARLRRMAEQGFVLEKLQQPFQYSGEYVDLHKLFLYCVGNSASNTSSNEEEEEEDVDHHHQILVDHAHEHAHEQSSSSRRPLIVEIGFGRGDNLFATACQNPQYRYLGAELYQPGVCNLLKSVEEQLDINIDIDTDTAAVTGQTSQSAHHCTSTILRSGLRVYGGDGMKLIRSLPPQSVSTVLITFPDPFAHTSNEKWRILQPSSILDLECALKKRRSSSRSTIIIRSDSDSDAGDGDNRDRSEEGVDLFPAHQTSQTQSPLAGRFFLATDDVEFDQWTRHLFQARQRQRQQQDKGKDNDAAQKMTTQIATSLSDDDGAWIEVQGDDLPPRQLWLPVVSQYEAKGVSEGRSTMLQCWEFR
jgi:tRNA G46 methylase TrmB